jgi:hypothetical protein
MHVNLLYIFTAFGRVEVCSNPATLVKFEKDIHSACLELLDGRLKSQVGILGPHFTPSVSLQILNRFVTLFMNVLFYKLFNETFFFFSLYR